MKFFPTEFKELAFPEWSFIAILFAFSILIPGDYSDSIVDSFKVFPTELMEESFPQEDFLIKELPKEKISSSKPILKLPFFLVFVKVDFFSIKEITDVAFYQNNKIVLSFNKPVFFFQNRIPSNTLDLPLSNTVFS